MSSTRRNYVFELILLVLAFLFFAPFLLMLLNSVKTSGAILANPLTLPVDFHFENFPETYKLMGYSRKFINSVVVTLLPIPVVVLISSLAGFSLSRSQTKLSTFIFFLFLSSMLIPFQVMMVPLFKMAFELGFNNSLWGLDLMYVAFGTPFAIFMYHGFVKSIPVELDEAATIDGCGRIRMFLVIILPLLIPVTTVIVILNSLGIWNDFLIPLIFLSNENLATLPLVAYTFTRKYSSDWSRQIPAAIMASAPIIIFFLILQRKIIGGIAIGSVKG